MITKILSTSTKKSRANFGAGNMLTTAVILLAILNEAEAQTVSPSPSDVPSDQPSFVPSLLPSDVPSGE